MRPWIWLCLIGLALGVGYLAGLHDAKSVLNLSGVR